MFLTILTLLMACSGDISIIKVYDDKDTNSSIVVDTSNTSNVLDGNDDISPDLTNVVGLARYHFKQIACPACVGVSSEFDIQAYLKLHYPTSGDYFEHLQYIDGCTTNIYDTFVSSQPANYNGNPSFKGLGQPIQLYSVGLNEWQVSGLYEYQYERLTQHSIAIDNIIIQDAFLTVEGFDWIEPYTLLWVDPSYAFEAPIYRSGTTFTWSPVVANTQFEVIVAVYSPDGSRFLGAVSCLENDSGSIFIPPTYLQSFSPGSLTAVHLIRHRMNSVVSPELGGTLQSHMLWEVIGTGHIE
tara:strand:- start:770 stop:1663 length:894 start_codon:yes stop_codon:yes gene_type:complete